MGGATKEVGGATCAIDQLKSSEDTECGHVCFVVVVVVVVSLCVDSSQSFSREDVQKRYSVA